MPTTKASELLRPGLLEGRSVLLAGAPAPAASNGSLGSAVALACRQLGARVHECALDSSGQDEVAQLALDELVEQALCDAGRIELLALDCASLFARAGGDGEGAHGDRARDALRGCLEASWNVTRAVANRAFLPDGRGGRIVYMAPASDAGEYGAAALAGLENLARTLSIEWARHGITTVTIAPGRGAGSASELAAVTAYLASPAGAYFSGCLLDLSSGVRPVLLGDQ
jgi:NAD(P)-dependent dehydrogenase (short-subunit alcohol dehydrogenase family)